MFLINSVIGYQLSVDMLLFSLCCALKLQPGSPGTNRCPTWSSSEIIQYLSVDLLMSGTTAILSTIYIFGAIFVAEVVRRNLRNYKCEYI